MEVFGARWKDYTEKLKKNWTALVKPTDTVILPGDISWAMTLEEAENDFAFLNSLPGTKIIGKGNHDFWWATMKKIDAFFAEKNFQTIRFLYNNAIRVENFIICGSRGWFYDASQGGLPDNTDYQKIVNREVMRLRMSLEAAKSFPPECERIVFLHFPPVFRGFRCNEITELLKEYGIRRCWFGHIHGVYNLPRTFVADGISFSLVSADFLNFIPQLVFPTSENDAKMPPTKGNIGKSLDKEYEKR